MLLTGSRDFIGSSVIILVVLLMMTAACSLRQDNNNLTLGSDAILVGQATLWCSQACADRGQCGTADQGEMVLVNSSEPVVTGHDMAISSGTLVNIDHSEIRQVIQISNNESMDANYYLINIPERGPGWAAGWCVAQ